MKYSTHEPEEGSAEYNASFTVGDISVTPWPSNSNRYEYYVNISAFSVAGSLGIFYLGQD